MAEFTILTTLTTQELSHLPVAVTVNNFSLSGYETVILHWAALQEGNS